MENITRKRIIFVLKLAVSFAILYWIFRKIDLATVAGNFVQFSALTFVLLTVTTAFKLFLQYRNWKIMLHLNPDYSPIPGQVFQSYLIGQSLSFLLPGGHATFGKVFFVENTSKKATLFSILMEKFFMTWTNLFFSFWAAIVYFPQFPHWLTGSAVVIISFLPLLLYFGLQWSKRVDKVLTEYRKSIPIVIVNQLITVFFTFVQYWLILNTFQVIAFRKVAISSSIILFANTIPITFSGLGLRETFAVTILKKYGITPEHAVTASLTIFIFTSVLPALIGLYFMNQAKKNNKSSNKPTTASH